MQQDSPSVHIYMRQNAIAFLFASNFSFAKTKTSASCVDLVHCCTIFHLRSVLWNINTDTQRTIYRYHLVGQLTSRWFFILRLEVDAVVEMVEEDALCWSWADPESPLLAFLTSHLTSSQSSRPHEGHNWKSFRLTFNFEADLSNSEFSEGDETWGLRWNQPESS